MTRDEAIRLLSGQLYIFAKTMPDNPHFYTLDPAHSGGKPCNWESREQFEAVVWFIRTYGDCEIFRGRKYIYLHHGGYKWWTMGAKISDTYLINRAEINLPKLPGQEVAE